MEREYKNSDGKVVPVVPYIMKAYEYEIQPIYGGSSDFPLAIAHPKNIEEKHKEVIHVIKQLHRNDWFSFTNNHHYHRFTPTEIVETKM